MKKTLCLCTLLSALFLAGAEKEGRGALCLTFEPSMPKRTAPKKPLPTDTKKEDSTLSSFIFEPFGSNYFFKDSSAFVCTNISSENM